MQRDVIPQPGSAYTTDTDLLVAIRGGDRVAFAELYRRTSRQLLGYVQQRVIDHAQSEEVLQEVFLEVWENAARFDPERAKASGWLHAIAHHRAIDRIRSAQKARERDLRIGIRDHDEAEHLVDDHIDQVADSATLREAMHQLTPLQREVIMLRYLKDLSVVETAQLLDVNVSTVKTRIRDGLVRMRAWASTGPGAGVVGPTLVP